MTRAGGAWGVTRERRGVTLILIALLIVVLVGMVGLSLDFSRYYLYRVELQTTADAAAQASRRPGCPQPRARHFRDA